jgi:hypothetical protein
MHNSLLTVFEKLPLEDYRQFDLEDLLIQAYRYSLTFHDIPEMWGIVERFYELEAQSGERQWYCPSLEYTFHSSEINEEILETILEGLGAEFRTLLGDVRNEAQNRLFEEEWRSHEPISYHTRHRWSQGSHESHLRCL